MVKTNSETHNENNTAFTINSAKKLYKHNITT